MRIAEQTLNPLKVLKAIRRHAPVSRSDLPALTGLSGGTITQVTADLVSRGLLVERKEQARQRRGRPRTYLSINASATVVVGVGLTDRGRLEAAFVNLAGTRLFGTDVPLNYSDSLNEFAHEIARALKTAIACSPFGPREIGRVGMAIPALVDSDRGIVHFIATFPPASVGFAEIIGSELSLPVTIENDVACMARAEHWFGRAQELDTFTIIYVGLLVGSAEYIGGLPRSGSNGFNSELGHIKTASGPDAPLCYCGARGCLSAFASMYGMALGAGRLPELTGEAIAALDRTVHRLLDEADSGDPEALAVIERAGTHLGIGVANHLNATDPGTVLILIAHDRLRLALADKIMQIASENTLPGVLRRTSIIISAATQDWRWKGTAALALEKLYLADELPVASQISSTRLGREHV